MYRNTKNKLRKIIDYVYDKTQHYLKNLSNQNIITENHFDTADNKAKCKKPSLGGLVLESIFFRDDLFSSFWDLTAKEKKPA